MLTYGFFNAVYTEGIPDRSYTADNLAEFFDSIIGDGVSADIQDGFKVIAGSGMQVNLNPGFCWIHGYYAKNTSMYPLIVSAAPPTDTRIDAVVLRWSRADRNILPQVLTGVASPNPQRPQIVRNADIYDLLLGYITLSAGESAITSDMITDTRADMDVCGIIDTFAARLVPDGSITNAKIADSAVTREKLAKDALYSPIVVCSGSSYDLSQNECGKTLINDHANSSILEYNIGKGNSQWISAGSEFAFISSFGQVNLCFWDNILIAIAGESSLKNAPLKLKISENFGMVALKKLYHDPEGTGDIWLVTGNVEVVS